MNQILEWRDCHGLMYNGRKVVGLGIGYATWILLKPSQLLPLIDGDEIRISGFIVSDYCIYNKVITYRGSVLKVDTGSLNETSIDVELHELIKFILIGIQMFEPKEKL